MATVKARGKKRKMPNLITKYLRQKALQFILIITLSFACEVTFSTKHARHSRRNKEKVPATKEK